MDHQRRKELATAYVQSHRPMGVYQIRNVTNGKVYIAKSMNLDGAFNKEKFTLGFNSHNNKELQKDWNEYGEAQFAFEILEQIKPKEEFVADRSELNKYKDELAAMEKKWLQQLQPYGERGYNKESVRG